MSRTCENVALLDHLVVDRVDVFFAAGDLGLDSGRGQALLERLENLVDDLPAIAARALDGFRQDLVAKGIEVRERQLLQLAIEAVQAQAGCDRRVDLERLARG